MLDSHTKNGDRIIKKYQNRRLYDTEESAYITLQEVKDLVLGNVNFVVQDANSGEDITRQVLLSIILEEEAGGVPLFSNDLLRQFITFYGHTFQSALGRFLEGNLRNFSEAQAKFQEQIRKLLPSNDNPAAVFAKMMNAQNLPNPFFGSYLENSKKMFDLMSDAFRTNPWNAGDTELMSTEKAESNAPNNAPNHSAKTSPKPAEFAPQAPSPAKRASAQPLKAKIIAKAKGGVTPKKTAKR